MFTKLIFNHHTARNGQIADISNIAMGKSMAISCRDFIFEEEEPFFVKAATRI